MSVEVRLPGGGTHRLAGGAGFARPAGPPTTRVAYAAAHVVADPRAENVPGAPATLDWETTLAFRHHLWAHGFGVAEAMDTAQRGMGLDHAATRELIRRSAAEARAVGGRIVAGVNTDHLPPGGHTVAELTAAYRTQLEEVLTAGARPVLMCSRHLAAVAQGPDDYRAVYADLLTASDQPVVLHWLGDMFDPALAGYWGSTDLDLAAETVVQLVKDHADKVDGIKISLLDADREVALRRRLPRGVRLYTGDDFHYPELIRGDEQGYSDALLGIFAAIAPAAGAALAALDGGDLEAYDRIMTPTVPLARHLFAAPTWHYKTGIVFLAWLTGHQEHFTMVAGQQAGRSPAHLARLLVLADRAGLLPDAELAAARARAYLTVAGVAQ